MAEDDEFDRAIENDPVFIASQLRAGHVLTEADTSAIQAVIAEMDSRENSAVDAFHEGRENALREIGGEELVTAVKMKDEERLARMVRAHMDKIFPKHQRTVQ
ncbi:hypothetical protein [Neorhizobium sp. DAR64872/K0K18]|uniref:hypothetical protein n=1 Tax=Neorhizobium sp. DAR64872/K0K18 TaxID=3421958 RepID=UPI003D2726CF